MNEVASASTARNPPRRKSRRNWVVAIVVIVAAGGGWYGWHAYKASKAKEGEYLYSAITKGSIEDLVTSTGTLQPRDYVDVGAQVSGQIDKIYVEVGDVVKRGDELVKIDAETSEAKMEATKANLESAKNSLKSQEENLEKAKRDVERQRNLYAQDATTKQSLLDAETTYNNAVRSKKNQELSIASSEANMKIDAKNLGNTTIVAPIDGTVMKLSVKLGQTVNATQSVPNVLQIANLNTMTVQSDVSEADVAKLYKGISVYFTTLGGNNRRWYGELKRIEPTPKTQNSVVLYNALFDVQNDVKNDGTSSLMPSMTAQVYFVSAQANDVLMVPMAAIQQGQAIARELAQKEREKNGKAGAAGAAAATAGATREGAPAAVAASRSAPGAGSAPTATAPAAPGGQGGFNPQNMTPEQREQMIARMRAQGGGFQGGANGQRQGGLGQRGAMGSLGNTSASAGGSTAGPRPVQHRNGTVMVRKADGTLETRRIVYGVTNRVQSEVVEGLKEGEEVVVGKRVTEVAAATPSNQQRNNNQGLPAGLPGGGPGGGGFPGGGGGRPF